jgi:hypothetical protein
LRPSFDAPEGSKVIGFKISPRGVDHLAARNNNYVYACQWFMGLEQLPHESFRPVSDHRIPNLLARGDAQPWRPKLVGQGETGHEAAALPVAALEDPCKFRPTPKLAYDDTDNRLRPLARRRLRTVRPFLVAIRTRKPCVRRRRRVLG